MYTWWCVVWFCGSHFAFAGSAAGYSIRQRKPKAGHDNTKQNATQQRNATQAREPNEHKTTAARTTISGYTVTAAAPS